MRRCFGPMVDGDLSGLESGIEEVVLAGVVVAVVAGEIAASDFESDTVSGQETVGGGAKAYFNLRDLSRNQEVFPLQRKPMSCPHHPVGDFQSRALRWLVDEAGEEICVGGRARDEQQYRSITRDFPLSLSDAER